MSDEAHAWLHYADENLRVAQLCLDDGLYNPSLQNSQQAVEKSLKALCISQGLIIKKTHSIAELTRSLRRAGVEAGLEDEECALLDSIYLPSKYPLGSVVPEYEPDYDVGRQCLSMAERTLAEAHRVLDETAK